MTGALCYALLGYGLAGLCTAAAFVLVGLPRALSTPTTFSWGARAVLFPGAFALWPYVLLRWLRSARAS